MNDKLLYIVIIIGLIYFFYSSYSKSKKANNMLKKGAQIIDVRTPQEFNKGHFKGSVNVPLNTIENNIDKIKSFNKDIVVVCASGMRSGKANEILNSRGITSVNGGSWSNLK